MPFALSSPAFPSGGTIPVRYTCDGSGVSPPLRWTAPPAGTHSLTLTVTDPDAPGRTFVHWRATGIPPRAGALAAGRRFRREERNSFGVRGWGAPCPPPGAPAHHYRFVLAALDGRGRTIAAALLVGRFGR